MGHRQQTTSLPDYILRTVVFYLILPFLTRGQPSHFSKVKVPWVQRSITVRLSERASRCIGMFHSENAVKGI